MTGTRLRGDDTGLTLIELMVWIALFTILCAMAVPSLFDAADSIRLGNTARGIERELQTARLKAVSANRPMRVKFNCPKAGAYRMLEVIGTAADQAIDRCEEAKYPYPAEDANPITAPNHDGPVRYFERNVTLGGHETLEFQPDGSVVKVDAAGVRAPLTNGLSTITVVKNLKTKSVTVNSLGKILLQR